MFNKTLPPKIASLVILTLLLALPARLHAQEDKADVVLPPPYISTDAPPEATQLTLRSLIGPLYNDWDSQQRTLYRPVAAPAVKLQLGNSQQLLSVNVTRVRLPDKPAHLLLLADNSGSMTPNYSRPDDDTPHAVATAAARLLDNLAPSNDLHFAVWSFHKTIQPHLTFQLSKTAAKQAVAAIQPQPDGVTCLYDALTTAVSAVNTFTSSRHRGGIILLTDGRDEISRDQQNRPCSQKAKLEDAIAVARAAYIPIHIILLPGTDAANRSEMEQLANKTGGHLLAPNDDFAQILAPFQEQWQIETNIYTLAGPQSGWLHITAPNGERLEQPIQFTAPRDFPHPPTIKLANNGPCGSDEETFTFHYNDPHQQISHVTAHVWHDQSAAWTVPTLLDGDANHLSLSRDPQSTQPGDRLLGFTLHPNQDWKRPNDYTLRLIAYGHNDQPLSNLERSCTFHLGRRPTPLSIQPDQETVNITDEQFTVALNIDGEQQQWHTLDVYVRQARGWWWWRTPELYQYRCPAPNAFATTQPDSENLCELTVINGSNKNPVAEKRVAGNLVISDTEQTATLTVPHAARGRAFLAILQARDASGDGLLPEKLPAIDGLNRWGKLQARFASWWNTYMVDGWVGVAALIGVLLLLPFLLNALIQARREGKQPPTEDRDKTPTTHSQFRLTVIRTPNQDKGEATQSILLGNVPVRIGRSPDCELSLPDDRYLSQIHAEIQKENGRFKIMDLNSNNGTQLQTGRGSHQEPLQPVPSNSFAPLQATARQENEPATYTDIHLGKTILRLQAEKQP